MNLFYDFWNNDSNLQKYYKGPTTTNKKYPNATIWEKINIINWNLNIWLWLLLIILIILNGYVGPNHGTTSTRVIDNHNQLGRI